MTARTRNLIISLIIIVILAAAVYFAVNHRAIIASTFTSATTTPATASSTSGTTVTVDSQPSTVPSDAPRIDAAINFGLGINATAKLDLQSRAEAIEASLKAQPSNVRQWVDLGTIKKIAGDYAGAKEDWLYASKLDFSNPTPHYNLGDLYATVLRDYPKAEQQFRQVISLMPSDTNSYRSLFEIYSTTSYKPTNTAAVDILKQGIAANPRAVDLQILLARYYRAQGDTADAKATFDAAIANATAQGQTDLAAQIKTDAASK